MRIWLVMRTADGGERPFPVNERAVIGRDTRCQVRIAMPVVCDQHCELQLIDGVLHLKDLKSANGTFHNGRRVSDAVLADADLLTVGPVTFEVRYGTDEDENIRLTKLKPVKEVLEAPEIEITARRPSAKTPRK